jgi:5'-3' exonuclease
MVNNIFINYRLRTRYPQIRMDLTDSNKQIPIIDNLYLDFNGIVYRCIAVSYFLFLGFLVFLEK